MSRKPNQALGCDPFAKDRKRNDNYAQEVTDEQQSCRCKHSVNGRRYLFTFLTISLAVALAVASSIVIAQQQQIPQQIIDGQQQEPQVSAATSTNANAFVTEPPILTPPTTPTAAYVDPRPPPRLRPRVRVNIRDWTRKLSEEIRLVQNRTNCIRKIESYFQDEAVYYQFDPAKARDNILNQINGLLSQHRDAVSAITIEAEKQALTHQFNKFLRFNYTDVHRLRNELEPLPADVAQPATGEIGSTSGSGSGGGGGGGGGQQGPQFTSINGGTPVPGPPEWQTPIKSIVMQMNKNFGDIPVNTSMSAVHLPLQIYAGLPEIINGIAWTEKLDGVFKRNLANYMHVHHQYYGSHLGFLRTFPAHKWRIPKLEPDLFDARTRPWYSAGASSPKDVVILVDTSGSMTGLRREIAKGVVFELLDTLTSLDYFSVMRFAETVTPVGVPTCAGLPQPKMGAALDEMCRRDPSTLEQRERYECLNYKRQWESRGQYLRDHPNIVPGKNGSYLTDELYKKSIGNITNDIENAYLLPATSRNIRYLKSNFSMPTAGIANFTRALMSAFELLNSYNRTNEMGSSCNRAIMLITDGAIKSHDEIFNRYNYPNAPVRVFTYMIGREVGDITHTKAMACNNRGYYTHVINLSEVREQVQKYLPVMARPLALGHHHPASWTLAYGDETHQVLTDWVLETKRRERARVMLNEERTRLATEVNSTDLVNMEITNLTEYDELSQVDELLKLRYFCEDDNKNLTDINRSLEDEIDPLGYNDLGCHWAGRRADLLTSVVKPVFYNKNTTIYFERVLHKNIWTEKETQVRNAQLLGVAAVDLRLADIMRLAPGHLLGPNGYAILLGHNGFVMHHPDLRALLEDPFDKQSKILKPYFNSVDLIHLEQVHYRNETDVAARRRQEEKLLKLREAALKRHSGTESVSVARAVDCRRRLHMRHQTFYYGAIKDTPFSLILALPQNYGLNRLNASRELSSQSHLHLQQPSPYDQWTIHPDFKYCEISGGNQQQHHRGSHKQQQQTPPPPPADISPIATLMEAIKSPQSVVYDDLDSVSGASATERHTNSAPSSRIVCDRQLLPALLFDAAATHESADSFCGSYEHCDSDGDGQCARGADEMRSKLANIFGVQLSFVATRAGLTRVRALDSSRRSKKLAELFVSRHNRAVDEAWYSRTVDWNMRFQDDATILTVPYNAYIRLVAKLRQRITESPPNTNETHCDSASGAGDESDTSTETGGETAASGDAQNMQNDDPMASETPASSTTTTTIGVAADSSSSQESATGGEELALPAVDYGAYSTYDFLDLVANSSVHISATQSVIANRGSRQRVPVAVTGLLYDYATFARRFLSSTSLDIQVLETPAPAPQDTDAPQVSVEICPGGECPTKCGYRNDTIDCLLIDNNGYIVVGEELPHVGRPLSDYDERLMQALVDKRLFHQVTLTDYQAICVRNPDLEQQLLLQQQQLQNRLQSQAPSSSSPAKFAFTLPSLHLIVVNIFAVGSSIWSLMSALLGRHLGALLLQTSSNNAQVQAQSMMNQSMLALLPNKTYLRPCERQVILYETRPYSSTVNAATSSSSGNEHSGSNRPAALGIDAPEYYVSKCGCSAWFVFEQVPKTNLVMLIVNTTLACRRCTAEQQQQAAPTNVIQVPIDATFAAVAQQKVQEEQVCTMLEREAQLQAQTRPISPRDTCYDTHPDESQIQICGAGAKVAPVAHLLAVVVSLGGLLLQAQCFLRLQPFR